MPAEARGCSAQGSSSAPRAGSVWPDQQFGRARCWRSAEGSVSASSQADLTLDTKCRQQSTETSLAVSLPFVQIVWRTHLK